MSDFERLKQEFDLAITDRVCGGLLFRGHPFKSTEELALAILVRPTLLSTKVRWSKFLPLLERLGFLISRGHLEVFSCHASAESENYFNSPLYPIFTYLANPAPEDFSLGQFL